MAKKRPSAPTTTTSTTSAAAAAAAAAAACATTTATSAIAKSKSKSYPTTTTTTEPTSTNKITSAAAAPSTKTPPKGKSKSQPIYTTTTSTSTSTNNNNISHITSSSNYSYSFDDEGDGDANANANAESLPITPRAAGAAAAGTRGVKVRRVDGGFGYIDSNSSGRGGGGGGRVIVPGTGREPSKHELQSQPQQSQHNNTQGRWECTKRQLQRQNQSQRQRQGQRQYSNHHGRTQTPKSLEMAKEKKREVEILIHNDLTSPYSASGSESRDAQYRKQAAMVLRGFNTSSSSSFGSVDVDCEGDSDMLGGSSFEEPQSQLQFQVARGGVGGWRGIYNEHDVPSSQKERDQSLSQESITNAQQVPVYHSSGGWGEFGEEGGDGGGDDDDDMYSLGDMEEIEELLRGYEKGVNGNGNGANGGGVVGRWSSSQGCGSQRNCAEGEGEGEGEGDDGLPTTKPTGRGYTPEGFATMIQRIQDLENDSPTPTPTPTPTPAQVRHTPTPPPSLKFLPGSSQHEAQILPPLHGGDGSGSGDYSVPFILPDSGSWNVESFSIPDSTRVEDQGEWGGAVHVEVPSSPMLPESGGKVVQIPSSQPEVVVMYSQNNINSQFPQVMTGDLSTSLDDGFDDDGWDEEFGDSTPVPRHVSDSFEKRDGAGGPGKEVRGMNNDNDREKTGNGEGTGAPQKWSYAVISSSVPEGWKETQDRSQGRGGLLDRQIRSSQRRAEEVEVEEEAQPAPQVLLPSSSAAANTAATKTRTPKTPSPRQSKPPPSLSPPPQKKPPSKDNLQTSSRIPFSQRSYGHREEQQEKQQHKPITLSPFPTTPGKKTYIFNAPPPPERALSPLSPCSSQHPPTQSQSSTTSSPDRSRNPLPLFTGTPSPPLTTLIPPPYELLSPAPETSSNPPLSTTYLDTLAQKPHTWKPYYKPKYVAVGRGEVRKWERGCWVVETGGWSCERKIEFWRSLGRSVRAGRCGAVSVFVGEEEEEEQAGEVEVEVEEGGQQSGQQAQQQQDGEVKNPQNGTPRTLPTTSNSNSIITKQLLKKKWAERRNGDRVKVYCWGGVLELIWAFLFVISNRKTQAGARWVDAAGKTVIQC